MDKVFVVKRVAEKLWATEDSIDAALANASKLMVGLVEAREELKVSHIVTDAATTKIAASLAALAEARKAMVEAHAELSEVKLRIGVRTKMDVAFKPWVEREEPEMAERRAV